MSIVWYWVVDPAKPQLTVFRLQDGRYVEDAVVTGSETYEAREPFSAEVTPSKLLG